MAIGPYPLSERWSDGLLGLPSVSNQTGDEIDEKVGRAAMTGVFNLGDIFELVNDALSMMKR